MTHDDVRSLLRRRCEPYRGRHGFGLRAWCREHNVNQTHASDFLTGKRGPANDLLDALGLEWVIRRKPKPRRSGHDIA